MRQPVPFGKYLLLDRVSVGGMAEVFKAKSFGVEGFEKVIAIKRILPSMGDDEDFIRMFIDEAKIAGQLSHANIGQIFELGRIDGAHFIAMEYIWGKDLLQIQNRYRKLAILPPVALACFVVMKTCEGLHYAHRKKDAMGRALEIVHRDCSPQNILVSYEGEVKLIDFGIAKAASRSARTNAGVLKGKFGYMSPEQVRGLPLDRRSDLFALGTILYETLTGERLFLGESDFSTLEKVRHADVQSPTHLNSEIPPPVEKIVMKALARDPADRYQWADEMRDDLRGYLNQLETAYTSTTLGDEMRRIFDREHHRERERMDAYRKLGRDGLIAGVPQAAARLDIIDELGPAPPLEGDPTMLDPPKLKLAVGLADGSGPVAAAAAHGKIPHEAEEPVPPADDNFEDKPTEIFGEIGLAHVLGSAISSERPPSGEVKVLVSASGLQPPAGVTEQGPPSFATRSQPMVSAHAGSAPVELPARDPESFPAPGRRRPSGRIHRDVVLGVAIAALLVGLVVAGKLLFFSNSEAPVVDARTATLVVLVDDRGPADVWIDGRQAGKVQQGKELTLDSIEPGPRELRVRRAGKEDCVEKLTLSAERPAVYNCKFPLPRAGSLLLSDLPETYAVLVDGKALSNSVAHQAIPLAVGAMHVVEIRDQTGELVERFELEVGPGEQRRHPVQRAPSALEAGTQADAAAEDPESSAAGGEGARDGERASREPATGPQRNQEASDEDNPTEEDEGAEPDEEFGYFTAFTKPWARVLIDDRDTGKMTPIAPDSKIQLVPGRYKVTFVVGEERHEFSVKIVAGKTSHLVKNLDAE